MSEKKKLAEDVVIVGGGIIGDRHSRELFQNTN